MTRFFVFVDTAYYPFVDDPIEAESIEEAERIVGEMLTPGSCDVVYVVPEEFVRAVRSFGARRRSPVFFALMERSKRYYQEF